MKENLRIQAILDTISEQNENKEIEFKSAHGGFPGSFWETYSSFANTDGGIIVFGIKEKQGIFSVHPHSREDTDKLKKSFFSSQNDRCVVSIPLLSDKEVLEVPYGDGFLLVFEIPRATREQRPVYVGQDPMTGTFRRNDEGDYRCYPNVVAQMFADRESTQYKTESRILSNYSWDDIDMTSFRQFRTMFANRTPSHPWTALDDLELLKKLGGYRKDRATGKEGFTLAGILMFGKTESITDPECAPDFMLDYREIPTDTTQLRWVDRIYPDGTWEANLFQFYRMVLPKLHAFMPKPFVLNGDERQDETPAHIALREALINALVHASYGCSARITILKLPNAITMSNPGFMLVSLSQYYEGGKSECRNPSLQKMFGLIGRSDKAGSGVDKILKGWKDARWRRPYIEERSNPEKVELFLPMESLISEERLSILKTLFGERIDDLDYNRLSILASAQSSDHVTNKSLQNTIELHPSDITKLLQELVRKKYLTASGFGRATIYTLNTDYVPSDDALNQKVLSQKVLSQKGEGQDTGEKSIENQHIVPHDYLNNKGRGQNVPSLQLSAQTYEERMVLEFCNQWRSAAEIALRIGRNRQHTRRSIIKRLLAKGVLMMEFPEAARSSKQRYKRVE